MRRGGALCAGAQWPIELNGSMEARGRSLKRNDALSDGMVRQIGGWELGGQRWHDVRCADHIVTLV